MKTAMIVIGLVVLGAALAYVAIDAPDAGVKVGETITTRSGLKYTDERIGSGRPAAAGDTVLVHYTGTFEDGTMFDSSRKRGEPIPVTIGKSNVIAGWHEGISGMRAGGKRKLIIPPDLAYGEEGRPGIPPNAVLLFELELVKIK